MSDYVKFTCAYKDTDFTRSYKIDNISTEQLPSIKPAILAINESLANGTDGGLSSFFVSDDYDASQSIGTLVSISAAQIVTTTTTNILNE